MIKSFTKFSNPAKGSAPRDRRASAGFTLIELLVVIAIIGILAGIVLASLGSARGGANDAKVKEQLKNVQTAAEIYYSANSNYGAGSAAGANCAVSAVGSMAADTASGFSNLVTAANWPASVAPTCTTNAVVGTAATKWSAWHVYNVAGNGFCVDSTGGAKDRTTAPAAGADC